MVTFSCLLLPTYVKAFLGLKLPGVAYICLLTIDQCIDLLFIASMAGGLPLSSYLTMNSNGFRLGCSRTRCLLASLEG